MHDRADHHRRRVVLTSLVALLGAAAVGAYVTADAPSSEATPARADTELVDNSAATSTTTPAINANPALGGLPDDPLSIESVAAASIDDENERADGGCTIGTSSIRLSASGPGVECLQLALAREGHYAGTISGQFDNPTMLAVIAYQEAKGLFVDGVVGRESAIELGIWPDEDALVVRTPPPPPETLDSTGYFLSPVASVGSDAPPVPANSGIGRRVVYERAGQRVWAIDADESIVRSWLVSGSKYANETPGTHTVYSRSEMSTAWNGKAFLPKMIRYLKTDIGHIGFHGIPRHVSDNSVYQTTEELGTRLSGGCQRQHDLDAAFLWAFADVGTTVVVV